MNASARIAGRPLPDLSKEVRKLQAAWKAPERTIEHLIALLDAIDGDADLEGELAGFDKPEDGREGEDTDAESSLGWTAHGLAALDANTMITTPNLTKPTHTQRRQILRLVIEMIQLQRRLTVSLPAKVLRRCTVAPQRAKVPPGMRQSPPR